MTHSFVIDQTMNLLGKALKVSAKRQSLITTNVANVDTIGYKPKDIDFKKTLNAALAEDKPETLVRTNVRHYGSAPGLTPPLPRPSVVAETVDIDKEMTRLAENNIQYRTSLEMLLRKMSMVKTAIVEGGR